MEIFLKKGSPFIFITPLIFLAAAVLFWKFALHPNLVRWIQTQVPEFNQSQKFVDIKFNDMQISLLKLQVSVSDAEVLFKNDFQKFNLLKIAKLKVQINPFELLIGQFNINSITVENLKWQIPDSALENSTKTEAEELPLDSVFNYLPRLPVKRIRLMDSEISITSVKRKLEFKSQIDLATVENLNYRLNLDIKKLKQTFSVEDSLPVTFDMMASASLTANQLKINLFRVTGLDSEIAIKGQFNQFKKVLIHPKGDFAIDSTILCDNLRTFYLNLFPQKSRLPSVSGKIQTSGKISIDGLKQIDGKLQVDTTNLTVDHFKFGKTQVVAQIKKNQLNVEQINFEHPAGLAELNQIEIQQDKPYHFKTKLDLKNLNLQKLFVSLGLTTIPADLNMAGKAACEGQLTPPFDIECTADALISDVVVKTNLNEAFSILKIKSSEVKGSIVFNSEDLQFDSQISIGKSSGLAKGVVNFEKGFKIDFESDQLSFKDIQSLAGLDLSGTLKLAGTTWGDSNSGSIETELNTENGEIENFVLGRFATELKYEKGHLFFRKLVGLIGQSDYAADLTFNFLNSSLTGTASSKKLFGEDLYLALNKKLELPFEITGIGAADISFSGPFNFWKLKYDLRAFLKHGAIAEESFERLDANLSSDGKLIEFKDVQLNKLKSIFTASGSIDTSGKTPEFNVLLKTNQSYIEEIDAALKYLPSLTGLIAANGKITGSLDNPEVKLNFNARQVNLDGFDYPASQGIVGFNKKYLLLNSQFFGRQLQADLKWPWLDKNDFSVKVQIRDLNALMLLPFISLPQPNSEFYSRLNLDADLKSETKSFDKMQGSILISDFLLQRGTQSLKLKTPASLSFNNGLKKMDPVDLIGEDNNISVYLLDAGKKVSRLSLKLAIKLRLLQFLVPFVESLNGQLEAQAQMALHSGPLQLFGDGQLTDGNLILKGFPTAIENISTPLEFSQSKIFLSDLSAKLGNSELEGSGVVEIKGAKNIVVQLQAEADNLELTFPDKVTTAGRAELNFSGSWLPYTLKVNYKVARGLVEKDFGQDAAAAVSIKGSHFLPPKQIESLAPSLLLDVAVDLSQGVVVKNKLLEGTATGNLIIKGSPENPLILGDINIKAGSKIIFKDKPFEVQTAHIHFPPANEINPEIYVSAVARVSDYDISLLVQGAAKNPTIEASSQPPLSKNDIFSLLALGMTSTKMDQNLSSEAQQRQTGLEVVAALSNQSEFNKKLQQTLGLTVQLAPAVDSTKNIAVPKVVVSKQILKKLNASYAKPLTGEQNQEVKLQYLFNPHWSGILNYQNKESIQPDSSINTQDQNGAGVLGGELEYKKEFKW